MTWLIVLLSIFAAASAALTIVAKFQADRRLEYICKPLTMVFIIAIVLVADTPISTQYRILILGGLAVSLVGDMLLMLPDHFFAGLVAFLTAHLFYIAAFTLEGHGFASFWYLLPFAIYGMLILRALWPYLDLLRGPVVVYVLVILFMAWQAANRWIETDQPGTLAALIGAYLFVTSDSVLALERFRGTWRSAPLWVLSTYFTAQWLIALSVIR